MKKAFNRMINSSLNIRSLFLDFVNFYPTIENGREKIEKKKYCLEKVFFPVHEFNSVDVKNWGSARPDCLSVFTEDNVLLDYHSIEIKTKAELKTGYDWDGNKVDRFTTSGELRSNELFKPEGIFSADFEMSDNSIGSWNSFWFLAIFQNVGDTYQEVDVFERFYSKSKDKHTLTSSVHKGFTSKIGRRMYNFRFKKPSKQKKINIFVEFDSDKKRIRIYSNGLLVFIGREWFPTMEMQILFGTSILKNSDFGLNEIVKKLKEKEFSYKISNIKHFTKIQ